MERFKSDSHPYIPAHERKFAIRKPVNYSPPSPGIFGFGVSSNVSRPTEMAGNSTSRYCRPSSHANYSNVHTNAPYISIEGRRKRRRTTVEDAFQNLSLRQQTTGTSATPDDHFRGTDNEMHGVVNCVTEQKAKSDNATLSPTPIKNDDMFFACAGGNATAVTPLTISKKLFSVACSEAKLNLPMGGNDDTGNYSLQSSNYSLHSNLSSIPDDFQVRRSNTDRRMKDDYSLSTTKYSDREDGDGQNSCCSATSSTCSTPEKNSTLHSLHNYHHHPLHDTFAPRKSKFRGGSRPGTAAVATATTDPVDARIEELIRHTRIRAMVEASIIVEKENEHKKNANTKDNDNFLMRVKNQQEDEKQMDSEEIYGMADGGLRRKNNGEDMGRRRVEENQQHNSMVTRDDIDLKLRNGNSDSLRNSKSLAKDDRQSGRALGGKPTNMDMQHVSGGHERGRGCQIHHNQGVSQDGTRGYVARPKRSKSLPKHAQCFHFSPSSSNRNATVVPSEDGMMMSS